VRRPASGLSQRTPRWSRDLVILIDAAGDGRAHATSNTGIRLRRAGVLPARVRIDSTSQRGRLRIDRSGSMAGRPSRRCATAHAVVPAARLPRVPLHIVGFGSRSRRSTREPPLRRRELSDASAYVADLQARSRRHGGPRMNPCSLRSTSTRRSAPGSSRRNCRRRRRPEVGSQCSPPKARHRARLRGHRDIACSST